MPHPDDVNALGGFVPLLVHSHGFGGNKYDDFSQPEHFVDAQAALAAWRAGYFVVSYTQRGFENSSGRIGVMSPDLEGRDFQELLDWLIKHIRGNSNGMLALDDPAGDSIYNFQFDAGNPDHSSTEPDPTDTRPSLLRNDNGTVLLGGEQAACDPGTFPTINPDCDPAVGTLGYSYGGGFQYTVSHADNPGRYGGERVDAIAPEGTWFDLRYSLHANDVPKTVWIELLTTFALQGGQRRAAAGRHRSGPGRVQGAEPGECRPA